MNVKKIQPTINVNRHLTPLSKYKGPKLDLMFYEKDEINLLKQELLRLENEAGAVMTTLDINKHLTGYQKNACLNKLLNIDMAIESIKNKIYNIKKMRYSIQKEEYKNAIK